MSTRSRLTAVGSSVGSSVGAIAAPIITIIVLAVSAILLPAFASASLLVTDLNSISKENLANTLIGTGITISNVVYSGDPRAAGTFSGGANIIGIESGILLSSGRVIDVVGPNTFDDTSTGFGTPGDPDLETLAEVPAGGTTFDAAILEFDFEATGPIVQFQYVFVSEEYNEFANSPFNNVFGFFINGVNAALLPDGRTAVAINNVNGGNPNDCFNGVDDDSDGLFDRDDPDCTLLGDNIVGENHQNAIYYIDNDCHDGELLTCPIDIQADGLTVVLTITSVVNPGTNHIKLVIGDAGDSVLDSWVFIEAESFVPANDSWTQAREITLNSTGSAVGKIDIPGVSRWYRFAVRPDARATVTLNNPPADYDLAVFKDIAAAFIAQVAPEDTGDLDRLNAEFAPSAFSPSAYSPYAFSPYAFSPYAFSPYAFSPDNFSPYAFSPTAVSPYAFSPYAFSPYAFSPYAFSPYAFSPYAFSPSAFSPETSPEAFSEAFIGAQVSSLIAVSAGAGTERVVADTWNNTGNFYVRVTGKNGTYDAINPFSLSVSLEGDLCANITVPNEVPESAVAGDYQTIILWNSARMDPLHEGNSVADMNGLIDRLNTLAQRIEVKGIVVDLAHLSHINTLQDQAEMLPACPFAVNLAAQAIKRIIDAYRAVNPDLEYIVIAGGDAAVPFFRYPDQSLLGPELAYNPPVAEATISQGSLRSNQVLGQDEYGGEMLSLRDGRFPVPSLAVGRLVESAADMNILLDAYLSTAAGIIDTPESSLVTGYDFLTDTANAVQAELVAGIGGRHDQLIAAADLSPNDPLSWTATDLRRELFDDAEDIIFLAGHFSASSALAADYDTAVSTDELAVSSVNLTNALVFSAGCHSGYNIVDAHGVPGVTRLLDWPQAFARKGATLVAGTGYQYGDTDFIEYSERLYLEFSRQLRTGPMVDGRGAVSIGKALVRAKQRYLAQTPDIRGLHRKSLLISTLFGLPMLKLDMPGARLVDETAVTAVVAAQVDRNPGLKLGLQTADIQFDFTQPRPAGDGPLQSVAVQLTNVEENNTQLTGTYFTGPEGVVTNPAEPALPLVARNVALDGFSARGIGFLGGAWTEQSVVPLTGAPATEIRGVHIPFSSPVNYPMRLATLNYFDTIAGGGTTTLLVTPAQHRVENFGQLDATLRKFDDLMYRVYFSNNTQQFYPSSNTPALAAPPTLMSTRIMTDGDDIVFMTQAFGDPAAGIHSVWVTFTDGAASSGYWSSLELIQDATDSTLWSRRLDNAAKGFGRLDAVFQAVNGVGLVSLNDNYGAYFQIAGELGDVGADGAPINRANTTITLTGPASGESGERANFQALLTSEGQPLDDATVLFTLGLSATGATTSNGFADASLLLSPAPGTYPFTATYSGDANHKPASVEQTFTVMPSATQLVLSAIAGESGVRAALTDMQGSPLPERTVYFTARSLDTGEFLFTTVAVTNNLGVAQLAADGFPVQSLQITARFLGEIPTGDGPLDQPIVLTDPVYGPAVDTAMDSDGDAVFDAVDYCAATMIPEGIPEKDLKPNHWSLSRLAHEFVTPNSGQGEDGRVYSTTSSVGCSCKQIIQAQGLGQGQTRTGCSSGTMKEWLERMATGT